MEGRRFPNLGRGYWGRTSFGRGNLKKVAKIIFVTPLARSVWGGINQILRRYQPSQHIDNFICICICICIYTCCDRLHMHMYIYIYKQKSYTVLHVFCVCIFSKILIFSNFWYFSTKFSLGYEN